MNRSSERSFFDGTGKFLTSILVVGFVSLCIKFGYREYEKRRVLQQAEEIRDLIASDPDALTPEQRELMLMSADGMEQMVREGYLPSDFVESP